MFRVFGWITNIEGILSATVAAAVVLSSVSVMANSLGPARESRKASSDKPDGCEIRPASVLVIVTGGGSQGHGNERHDIPVNGAGAGEVIEFDHKSVGDFLSLGNHEGPELRSNFLPLDYAGGEFRGGDLAQLHGGAVGGIAQGIDQFAAELVFPALQAGQASWSDKPLILKLS